MGNIGGALKSLTQIEMIEFDDESSDTFTWYPQTTIADLPDDIDSFRIDGCEIDPPWMEVDPPRREIISRTEAKSPELIDDLSRLQINKPEVKPVNNIPNFPSFQVFFTFDALNSFKKLAQSLEVHSAARDMVEDLEPFEIPELERFFEQKLAMYIILKIRQYSYSEWSLQIIKHTDIIAEINNFVRLLIQKAIGTFPPDGTIEHLLDGYPISLLSQVCQTGWNHSHIIGESVRRLVELRKTHFTWFPPELQAVSEGKVPLTGHPQSPLIKDELTALHRYLGSRRNIYVHILLNSLYELKYQNFIVNNWIMNEEELSLIIRSAWFYLFLFGAIQNINPPPPSNPTTLVRSESMFNLKSE